MKAGDDACFGKYCTWFTYGIVGFLFAGLFSTGLAILLRLDTSALYFTVTTTWWTTWVIDPPFTVNGSSTEPRVEQNVIAPGAVALICFGLLVAIFSYVLACLLFKSRRCRIEGVVYYDADDDDDILETRRYCPTPKTTCKAPNLLCQGVAALVIGAVAGALFTFGLIYHTEMRTVHSYNTGVALVFLAILGTIFAALAMCWCKFDRDQANSFRF